VVALGGRTGRDGIHGATFSSVELTSESETVSSGAVQIGNAIEEKKVLDVMLRARDAGYFSCVTECGAGGFSSWVGEMGAEIGAEVDLDKVPLKYAGQSYTEIWISEAQERMVVAVPPEHWDALATLCRSEDVEATVIGRLTDDKQLRLRYQGRVVGLMSMDFLHEGVPQIERDAGWDGPCEPDLPAQARIGEDASPGAGRSTTARSTVHVSPPSRLRAWELSRPRVGSIA